MSYPWTGGSFVARNIAAKTNSRFDSRRSTCPRKFSARSPLGCEFRDYNDPCFGAHLVPRRLMRVVSRGKRLIIGSDL